ncbi:hypothetical protein TL16_g04640 [Triparma laevis f. inornata]|uniref:Uncharacterized protein n=1 Tax=Triparma laevis f. inornata TaxID=1714386 RepID=A0A9W7ADJ6_9STRA|nr:hypothetical protein TL16_g04640 [Triparma laevis f. inornata]
MTNSMTLAHPPTAPAVIDQFMHTPELGKHFIGFVHVRTLMALIFTTKRWNAAADALIDEGVQSGELMVHNGTDISCDVAEAQEEKHKLVTRVIYLLNITKVGKYACCFAINLIVVDIPEELRASVNMPSMTAVV